jgi:hypothetical protein
MGFGLSNATKGAIILVVNSGLALLVSFGVNLTDAQQASILGFANALLGLWLLLTYQDSPYRREPYDDTEGGF